MVGNSRIDDHNRIDYNEITKRFYESEVIFLMRRESFQQFAIVAADSAQALTEELNEKLRELKDKHPQVTFEGLIARISYTEELKISEELSDEYEEVGINFTCQACPMFKPALKADGTIDKRAKWGGCEYSPLGYGQTTKQSKCCSRLFEMINSGEVKLCLAESEE